MLQIHYMNVVKQFSSKYTKQNASNLSAAEKQTNSTNEMY